MVVRSQATVISIPLRGILSRREEGFIRDRLLRDPDGTLRDEAWFENPAFGLGPVRVLDHSLGVPPGGEWFSYR